MKQSLQLKIGQSLTMTPQLQQAIKLLQLSSLDLQSEIQQVLDSNPLLDAETSEEINSKDINTSNNSNDTDESTEVKEVDSSSQLQSEQLTSELATDSQWEDWGYTSQSTSSQYKNGNSTTDYEYQGETSESLQDQLLWQINIMNLSEIDKAIATILIDSIDEKGYLQINIDDIKAMFHADDSELSFEHDREENQIDTDEIQAIIHLLQSFEPAGIAARDLQECLLIQLKRCSQQTSSHLLAKDVIEHQFELLSTRNYRQIIKNMSITEEQLKNAVTIIQSLDPRPGNQINSNTAQYVTPDVYASKDSKGIWSLRLNTTNAPKLKINKDYAALIKRADNSNDNIYLKNNLQDAKWFIKSLQSRNDTLLKVASCIIEKQVGFLEYGEEAMKPLILADIAEEVEMHESTISRVTTQKYIHTPKGIFELKYFFSSHVSTSSGGECSSTAIRAVIKKLIESENQAKPLSDNKLTLLLKEQGINVARRTIAKYRESMLIPPSNERKQLI